MKFLGTGAMVCVCVGGGGGAHHENLTSLYVIMVVAWRGETHHVCV